MTNYNDDDFIFDERGESQGDLFWQKFFEQSEYELTPEDKEFFEEYAAFGRSFTKKVLPIMEDFYPECREKKQILQKKLYGCGKDIFQVIEEITGYFLRNEEKDGFINLILDEIDISFFSDALKEDIINFQVEDFEYWYKLKTNFEPEYVRCFYAGVFIMQIYKMLAEMVPVEINEVLNLSHDGKEILNKYLLWQAQDIFYLIDMELHSNEFKRGLIIIGDKGIFL